jgi:hypothetical protein
MLTNLIKALKWLFLTSEPVVWCFTNPAYFITAPLFVIWFNFLLYVGKSNVVAFSFPPYVQKSTLGNNGAIGLYVASWKYHLNRWFGAFPRATYATCSDFFGWQQ